MDLDAGVEQELARISGDFKSVVAGHLISECRRFHKTKNPSVSDNSIVQTAHAEFETVWNASSGPLTVVPGKKCSTPSFIKFRGSTEFPFL